MFIVVVDLGTMRQIVFFFLCVSSIACFIGYCAAMIDWIQDVKTGVYQQNYGEAFIETLLLLTYTYLAVQFIRSKINLP